MKPRTVRSEQYLVRSCAFHCLDYVVESAYRRGVGIDIRISDELIDNLLLGSPIIAETAQVWNDEVHVRILRRQHVYYLRVTRRLYLQQLRELGDAVYLQQVSIWYAGPWQVLAEAAGMRLCGWDQEAEPGAAGGRS